MTDPDTLTPEQRSAYVRQLQKSLVFWQNVYARSRNMTHEDMLNEAKLLYRSAEPNIQFRRMYECEWLG